MSLADPRLPDLLESVRDIAVGELLEALARALETGADVTMEPKLRDTEGFITREGALKLPRRGDLEIDRNGRKLVKRVECPQNLPFAPIVVPAPNGFVARVAPFHWEAAEIIAEGTARQPNWGPVRLWFLEWFQSRYSEVSPDLDGAVHALSGPAPHREGWRFVVDFGSAPVDAVVSLIGAFAETGCQRIRIGRSEH